MHKAAGTVSITNRTRREAPRLPFGAAAQKALPGWDISLVFVGPKEAQALNKKMRRKTYTPNVLSYEVGKKSGEIIICPDVAKKQAPSYELDAETFTLKLFIHGCLHLKGYPHGTTMEAREQKLLALFAKRASHTTIHGTTNRNRNRHRHLSGEDRRTRRNAR